MYQEITLISKLSLCFIIIIQTPNQLNFCLEYLLGQCASFSYLIVCIMLFFPHSYGPATQVRWLQDPKPADKAAAAVAKRPAPTPPPV